MSYGERRVIFAIVCKRRQLHWFAHNLSLKSLRECVRLIAKKNVLVHVSNLKRTTSHSFPIIRILEEHPHTHMHPHSSTFLQMLKKCPCNTPRTHPHSFASLHTLKKYASNRLHLFTIVRNHSHVKENTFALVHTHSHRLSIGSHKVLICLYCTVVVWVGQQHNFKSVILVNTLGLVG